MNEAQMHRVMMIAGLVLTIISGVCTVGIIIYLVASPSWALFGISLLATILTIGFGAATMAFGEVVRRKEPVLSTKVEQEVLTTKQRRDLRKARGEVVMERALIDIEHERQNIVHRQLEAANDPGKPPHNTTWTSWDEGRKRLR